MSLARELASSISATAVTSTNAKEWRGGIGTGTSTAGVLKLTTAETTVVDADQLGRIDFSAPLEASGTDALLVGASIYAEADNTFAADNNQTELVFATGASEAAAEKMRIASDGKVGIGTTAPASLLDVRGTVQVGVNDTGHDVKFFGDTASRFMEWDASADKLTVAGKNDNSRILNVDDGVDDLLIIKTNEIVINETSRDTDFRVESNNEAHMLFVDGGNDRVGIGTSAPSSILTVAGTGGTTVSAIENYGTTAAQGAQLNLSRSNNGTLGTQTAVDSDDLLGEISYQGSSGSAFISGARIAGYADGTFSGTAAGSTLRFYTADNSTTTLDERMRIDHNGSVGINEASPASKLHVAGTVQVGYDDNGHNVVFYGATAGSNLTWNQATDSLHLTDSTRIKLGDSQDFTLYHDGSNSYIANGTGALKIATTASGIAVTIGHTTSETTVADNLNVTGIIKIQEQAAAESDTTAYGQIWVKNTAPSSLYFTGDTGVDQALASTGKAIAMAMIFGG